jgi:hypothetical protein
MYQIFKSDIGLGLGVQGENAKNNHRVSKTSLMLHAERLKVTDIESNTHYRMCKCSRSSKWFPPSTGGPRIVSI